MTSGEGNAGQGGREGSAAIPADEVDLERSVTDERWELLRHVDAALRVPMAALAFAWLVLLVVELTQGLGPRLQLLTYAIWAVFVFDFLLELVIAPEKAAYLRTHWLTALSLVLPALRVLRVFRAFAVLRAARFARSTSLLRLLTSLNRGMRVLGQTLGRRGLPFVLALTVVVTLVGAAGMAYFESPAALAADAGREVGAPGDRVGLDGYGDALWWTAMAITTMGSEYWPKSPEGRVVGWLLAVYAFTVFGYITAAIASFFVRADREEERPDAEGELQRELARLRTEVVALRTTLGASGSGG